ncbi:MAG: lysylphosphatidylglycerol synthase transmembrane domain-containing protein [Chitinophagia bacterium]
MIFLTIGIALLWLTTRSMSPTEIGMVKNLIFSSNWLFVVPCILVLLLSHYIRALRWKSMIAPLGYTLSIWNVFMTVISGFFFNLLFPRLGEVMKCTLLGKYEKIPVDKLIGTMVAERMVDLLCLVLVIFLTIISQFKRVWAYTDELVSALLLKLENNHTILFIATGIIIVLCIGIYLLIRSGSSSGIKKKLKSMISGFYEGVISFKKIPNRKKFIAHTLFIWFLYLLSIKVGFYAMQPLAAMGWPASLTILTFGSFAMIATQGGIGAYQLAVQKTLTLYGVNAVSGLAFGWLLWSVQTIMLLISGPICLLILLLYNRKKYKR